MPRPSKRSKATDQRYISLDEYRENKALRKTVVKIVHSHEPINIDRAIIKDLGWKHGRRLVQRVINSSRRQNVRVLGLLQKLVARA